MIDSSWYVRPPGVKDRTSAGGIVVRRRGGQLLVAMAREGDHASFVLPKGGVDDGENLEQAARREILEEAGLDNLTLLADLGARPRLDYNKRRWMTIHYFLFLAGDEGGRPTDKKHPHPATWVPLDDLPPMFWPEQRELIEANRAMIRKLMVAHC